MGETRYKKLEEREISLVDFGVEMLLHWRMILLAMMLSAILFATYSYKQSYDAAQMQKIEQQTEAELVGVKAESLQGNAILWSETCLNDAQINNVKSTIEYERLLEEKLRYQQNTLAMNVDPYCVSRGEVTFLIKSSNMESTYNIQKAYEDIVTGTGLFDYLNQECQLLFHANQVVGLEKSSYSLVYGSDIVRIVVSYNDEEQCEKIVDSLIEYVNEQKDLLEESMGRHELIVLNRSIGNDVVMSYVTEQNNCMKEIMSLRKLIAEAKTAFSPDEIHYYDYLTTGEKQYVDVEQLAVIEQMESMEQSVESQNADAKKENNEKASTIIVEPGISFKYTILGMTLGAFIYVFGMFVKYILNNKLRPTENFSDLYNIPQLGFIPMMKATKKLFGGVDEWILRLRDCNKRRFTVEESINMAGVALKMAVCKASDKEVWLIGCGIKSQTLVYCERLKALLCESGIDVLMLDNILYDAEAMACLEKVKCAVLVEKAGYVLYDEVLMELELLERQDITVLGGIVIE